MTPTIETKSPSGSLQGFVSLPRRIQFSRKKGWKMPPNTVLVSRPSQWGNIFTVDPVSAERFQNRLPPTTACRTAAEAVERYEKWLTKSRYGKLVAKMVRQELAGKNLACWCKVGKPCHADVLLRLANDVRYATPNQ